MTNSETVSSIKKLWERELESLDLREALRGVIYDSPFQYLEFEPEDGKEEWHAR